MSHPGSHPWQLEPVVTNRDNWLGTIDKDKLILQLHRLQFKSMYDDNDQYDDMEVGNSESAVTEPPAPATTTTREELIERLKNVQAFTRLLEKVKQIHQTQSSSIGNFLVVNLCFIFVNIFIFHRLQSFTLRWSSDSRWNKISGRC